MQRYYQSTADDRMEEHDYGDYVLYEDHLVEVAALKEENVELNKLYAYDMEKAYKLIKELEEKCELYLRTNKTHLDTMLVQSKRIKELEWVQNEIHILRAKIRELEADYDYSLLLRDGLQRDIQALKEENADKNNLLEMRQVIIDSQIAEIARLQKEANRTMEELCEARAMK